MQHRNTLNPHLTVWILKILVDNRLPSALFAPSDRIQASVNISLTLHHSWLRGESLWSWLVTMTQSQIQMDTLSLIVSRLWFNDLTIGWQNWAPLRHPHATLAPQAKQARPSGEILNYLPLAEFLVWDPCNIIEYRWSKHPRITW